MRKHSVDCKIEDKSKDKINNIQYYVNLCYVQEIEHILEKSELSRDEKIVLIEKLESIWSGKENEK